MSRDSPWHSAYNDVPRPDDPRVRVTRIFRLLLAAVCGLLSVLAVAGGAGWLWLRTSLPETGGTVEIAGAIGTQLDHQISSKAPVSTLNSLPFSFTDGLTRSISCGAISSGLGSVSGFSPGMALARIAVRTAPG